MEISLSQNFGQRCFSHMPICHVLFVLTVILKNQFQLQNLFRKHTFQDFS